MIEPTTCEGRYWSQGADQRCTQQVGLTCWQDSTGIPHAGCPTHAGGLKRRYPATLPESLPVHGRLHLSTPWARGAFGPADVVEIENLIPDGWAIGVSVSANRSFVILWLNDPDKVERTRWQNHRLRNAVSAARELALLAQTLVSEGPAPDAIDEYKREAERWTA